MTAAHGEVRIARMAAPMAVLGVVGVLFALAGLLTAKDEAAKAAFLQSYHYGWTFFWLITMGCFGLTLFHHTTRAQWGLPVLRIFEGGGGPLALLLIAVLFIPQALNLPLLFPWADVHHQDAVIQSKAWWLNTNFFLIRYVFYFLTWFWLASVLRRSSVREDESKDPTESQYRTNRAAPGLVFFFLTMTIATTDFIMSLEPHWFSTVYGVLTTIGGALAAMAFATILYTANIQKEPYASVASKTLTRDHGNMLFALTMLWAYLTLSQFLIIWSANLKEEIPYYITRSQGNWNFLGLVIIIGQFFGPFLALLAPKTKHTPRLLLGVAIWILIMRVLDVFWMVIAAVPGRKESLSLSLYDVAALVGVGGLWLAAVGFTMAKAAIFPKHDPRIREAIEHAHA